MSDTAGYLYVLAAWVMWGTYPVPFKSPAASKANIDPVVFQCYKTTCVFLTAWITLLWKDFTFTYWGFVGAALWVPAGIFYITAVKLTGVAFTAPICNGTIILVAFFWGAFYFENPIHNPLLTGVGLTLMVVGICGISFAVNYEKIVANRKKGIVADESYVPVLPKKVIDGTDEKTPLLKPTTTTITTTLPPSHLPPPHSHSPSHSPSHILPPSPLPPAADVVGKRAGETRNMVLGSLCALMCGLFGGSMNVPLKHAPASAHGIQYVVSFGIGAMVVTIVITTIYVAVRYMLRLPPPIVNLRVSFLPGTLAGSLWAFGNIFQLYACFALGQAVGYPAVQCNMFIAGCWGVFYYNEAPRIEMKVLFIFACAILITGVVLLSRFG